VLPWSGSPGQADAYISFLTETLKPLIDPPRTRPRAGPAPPPSARPWRRPPA
jgi:hypothetical protein